MDELHITLLEKAEGCTYHCKNKSVKTLECYSEISIKNVIYQTGEFVVLKSTAGEGIGQIRCFFYNEDLTFEAIILRYYSANKFKTLFESEGYEFDKYKEVVQDAPPNCYVTINLSDILRKCNLIILTINDDYKSVQKNGLNITTNYFCRFKIKSDGLCPLLPTTTGSGVLIELNANKSPCVASDMKDYTNVPSMENNYNDFINIDEVTRRNSVRRNLNSSFIDVTNYSIIVTDDDDEDESLKLRLRKSRHQSKSEIKYLPNLRKSTRNITRKSYADYDYESPEKRSNLNDPSQSNRKMKTRRNLNRTEFMNVEAVKPKNGNENDKIVIKPSPRIKRNNSYLNVETPEKNLKQNSINNKDKHILRTPSKRNVKNPDSNELTPRRSKRTNSDSDDIVCDSPAKENLNDSLRTQILKVKLENLHLSDTHKPESEMLENEQHTPSRSTRKTRRRAASLEPDDSDSDYHPSTPKSKMSRRPSTLQTPTNRTSTKTKPSVTGSKTPKTPRSRATLIREGIITPSMQSRHKAVKSNTTPLMKARSQLHVSYVPKSLPCREKEYEDVYKFLEDKLLDGFGGCMYISGVPGTGKTATVTCVINNLQQNRALPEFTFVSVNAMRLTEPRQSYVEIFKQLTGKSASWEQAQSQLEDIFMKSKTLKPVVVLIDELDILCTKRQDVVYNLLDWPTKAKNQLIVITIANTMDLPERLLMSRVASRLGLTRLTFQAYTYKQLQEIVMKRLCGIDSFNPDAIQFVARKVAAVSGDARRALDICRRAAEIAEAESGSQLVNMNHVNEALNAMIAQPKVQAIKHCSKLEKLFLKAIVTEVERTGVEETTFSDVYKMLISVASLDGFSMVSITVALLAVSKLSSWRLIITDQKCNDIHQRIVLNVSVDDVYFALKEHSEQ